jgi:hypothetical protein
VIPVGIDAVLERVRAGLRRVSPAEALEAVERGGAVLVDTRPEWQRRAGGEVPGAIVIERNHPAVPARPRGPGEAGDGVTVTAASHGLTRG